MNPEIPPRKIDRAMPLTAHPDLAARFWVEERFAGGEGESFAVRSTEDGGGPWLLKLFTGGTTLEGGSVLASLDHPRIPRLIELGRTASGSAYLLREFAPGSSLADLAPVDPARLVEIGAELCEVLALIHLRGILHLDLKPANVIVDRSPPGEPSTALVDFGFAQRGREVASRGTPFFCAPEMMLGAAPDPRTDLFSLGATLLAALVPDLSAHREGFFLRFPRTDFLTALGLQTEDLPPPFHRILPRLLERRPERRFADAQEVLEALRGRGGRPSPGALAIDTVAAHGAAIAATIKQLGAGEDLVLRGLDGEDLHTLALHAACVLGDADALVPDHGSITVRRGTLGRREVVCPPLDAAALAPLLADVLQLDGATADAVSQLLIGDGVRTASTVTRRLQALAGSGVIRPDGASWCWPDAAAGRADVRLPRDAADEAVLSLERIEALAARGQVDGAERMARRAIAATEHDDGLVRAALARGLLAAGEGLRALPFTHDLPLLRGRALLESGDVRGAAALVDTAMDQGVDSLERRLLRAGVRYHEGRVTDGLAELQSADDAQSLVLAGALLATADRRDEARAALDAAIERTTPESHPFVRAAALVARGELARRSGRLVEARADQEEALALFRRVGNAHAAASAALNLGVVSKDLGDHDAARGHLRRARALFRHVGDTARELTAEANLGIVLLADGDPRSALERFDSAIAGLEPRGAPGVVNLCRAFRAQALARLGDRERARLDLSAIQDDSNPRLRDEAAKARELLTMEHHDPVPDGTATPTTDDVPRAIFRTFLAVNRRLAAERELERAMQSLLEAAETVTGARSSYLLVERGAGLRLELASHIGSLQDRAFSRSLANKALSAGRTMTAEDALGDRDLMDMPSVRDLRVRSALCVPFHSASGTAGALYVEHSGRAGAFGPREAELLEALADQASIAVERMLREEELTAELAHSKRDLQVVRRKLGRGREARIVGASPAIGEMQRQVEKFARSDLAVLVQGETGTGKELVARALHDASLRADHPFVSENCSAIPPDLMESELFGHTKGAFTGADADRPGLFELAGGGTLFLDEVGDMPASMQVKLLRALQEKTIRRVGGRETIPIDVRIVTATHKDLEALVREGTFREDLYFRIAAGTIRVPPLRERPGDIDLLAQHFLERSNREQGRSVRMDENGLARLRTARWPGNVRELEHVIARAFVLTEGDILDLDDLSTAARGAGPQDASADTGRWPAIPLNEAIYRTLHAALRATGGDKSAAARLLQISRTALYEKLRREAVDRPTPGSFEEL